MPRGRPIRVKALRAAALMLLVVGCGTNTGEGSTADGPEPAAMPTSVPPPDGEVTVRTLVLDKDRPELCLGGVDQSLPPQCGGPPIDGWDWADFAEGEDFDSASGVTWGDFVVWGSYDGTTFTLDRALPADEVEAEPRPEEPDRFQTSCDEPAGGWVVDPAKTDFAAKDAVSSAAHRLDGYAGAFVDTSRDPRSGEQVDQDAAAGNEDASLWIFNVAVTGDLGAAEAELRKHWGGGLCVFQAEYSDAEVARIQGELNELPGALGSGRGIDSAEASVVWDDGSLQAWADSTYGEGIVEIDSLLQLT